VPLTELIAYRDAYAKACEMTATMSEDILASTLHDIEAGSLNDKPDDTIHGISVHEWTELIRNEPAKRRSSKTCARCGSDINTVWFKYYNAYVHPECTGYGTV